jgi:hypothetical protein
MLNVRDSTFYTYSTEREKAELNGSFLKLNWDTTRTPGRTGLDRTKDVLARKEMRQYKQLNLDEYYLSERMTEYARNVLSR